MTQGFRRADLVKQLRELDVAAAAASADPWDRPVLAAALGVTPAALAAAVAHKASGGLRGGSRRAIAPATDGAYAGGGKEDEAAAPGPGPRAHALARQLALALLLRPMDGV